MKIDKSKSAGKAMTHLQQVAIDSENYPVYIEASAGTGKTEVLSAKIENLIIEKRVPLSDMAIITFTNKATAAMRERLYSRLYQSWLGGGSVDTFIRKQIDFLNIADISTIHAFCVKVIQDFGMYIGIAPNFTVSGFKAETNNIIKSTTAEHYKYDVFRDIPPYKIEDAIRVLSRSCSDKGVLLDKVDTNGETVLWADIKNLLHTIYNKVFVRVEEAKCESNILNQNDLIRFAADLAQIPEIAEQIAARYKYIIVDEMQDTNRNQYRFINALMIAGTKLVIAGDRKQSIYKFRGADISSFDEMVKDLSAEDKAITLQNNFRSNGKLLDEINHIFDYSFRVAGYPLNFTHQPQRAALSNVEEESGIRYISQMDIVKVVKEYLFGKKSCENIKKSETKTAGGIDKSKNVCYTICEDDKKDKSAQGGLDTVCYNINIGILCRFNFDLNLFAWRLARAGIPIEVRGSSSFYKSKAIIDTYKIFNALINSGGIEEDEARFTDYYSAYKNKAEADDFDSLLIKLRQNLRSNTITKFLRELYESTGVLRFYEKGGRKQERANLIKLIDVGRAQHSDGLQPVDFLRFLDIMISSSQEDSAEAAGRGAVVLSTVHRAKGLDFDVVIIPQIEGNLNRSSARDKIIYDNGHLGIDSEYLFGKQSQTPTDRVFAKMRKGHWLEQMAEELRVMYVAFTRARHTLILGTEKPESKIEYRMSKDARYVSIYRWLYDRYGGRPFTR